MAAYVYGLCSLVSLLCAGLLLRGYFRSEYRLLLWSGICFAGLATNNILLVLDKLVFRDMDLMMIRTTIALVAMCILLYGLVWDTK